MGNDRPEIKGYERRNDQKGVLAQCIPFPDEKGIDFQLEKNTN